MAGRDLAKCAYYNCVTVYPRGGVQGEEEEEERRKEEEDQTKRCRAKDEGRKGGQKTEGSGRGEPKREGLPVAMEETAAQVHTMTVLPSLRPRVCSMKPREDMRTEPASPTGKASHPTRATIVMPVLQLAADSPKHTPACTPTNAGLHSSIVSHGGWCGKHDGNISQPPFP